MFWTIILADVVPTCHVDPVIVLNGAHLVLTIRKKKLWDPRLIGIPFLPPLIPFPYHSHRLSPPVAASMREQWRGRRFTRRPGHLARPFSPSLPPLSLSLLSFCGVSMHLLSHGRAHRLWRRRPAPASPPSLLPGHRLVELHKILPTPLKKLEITEEMALGDLDSGTSWFPFVG